MVVINMVMMNSRHSILGYPNDTILNEHCPMTENKPRLPVRVIGKTQ